MAGSGVGARLAVTNVDEKKKMRRRQACSCLLNVHDSLKPIQVQIRLKAMTDVCSMCQTLHGQHLAQMVTVLKHRQHALHGLST